MEHNYQSGSLNWLSYGAILVIEELRRQKRKVAFFLAQTTLTAKKHPSSSREVMAALIYQIAEMHDDLLRSKVDRLKSVVQSSAWRESDEDKFLSKMQLLFRDIFSAFPQEEKIFIVIDRLDQCAWQVDEDGSWDLEMRHTIEALVRIATRASCHVKILLTIDDGWYPKASKARNALDKKEKTALLLKADWCQAVDEDESGDDLCL